MNAHPGLRTTTDLEDLAASINPKRLRSYTKNHKWWDGLTRLEKLRLTR
jgi:hypothetical protein